MIFSVSSLYSRQTPFEFILSILHILLSCQSNYFFIIRIQAPVTTRFASDSGRHTFHPNDIS